LSAPHFQEKLLCQLHLKDSEQVDQTLFVRAWITHEAPTPISVPITVTNPHMVRSLVTATVRKVSREVSRALCPDKVPCMFFCRLRISSSMPCRRPNDTYRSLLVIR